MTSRAHELYRQIIESDDPVAHLRGMITSKRTETEYLEFKGAGRIADRQIKEFWSQALSGFANTEGGVVIWGIRAARIEDPDDASRRIDAASELDLVPQPSTFEQLLRDVLLEACLEPVQGVDFVEFDAGEGDGSGFLVCLIPEGKHKPYRAELDPKRQYYQRIGDNFVVIPHSLLRSLFYPRTTSNLSIFIRAESTVEQSEESVATARFEAEISNTGKATGKDVCVLVETPIEASFQPSGYQVKDLGLHTSKEGSAGSFRLKQNLHPGQSSSLFICTLSGKSNRKYGAIGHAHFAYVLPWEEVTFRMRIFCLDQEGQDVEVTFNVDEIKDKANKEAKPID